RSAQVQFLDVLRDIKRSRAAHDHALLRARILDPEARVQGLQPAAPVTGVGTVSSFRETVRCSFGADSLVPSTIAERVYLLYREYLGTAPLHHSSRRTTDQFLGNPCLATLTRRLLAGDRRMRKQLRVLDLAGGGSLGGPALWFNIITLAVAERTGRLVDEYNRRVLTLAERRSLPAADPRRRRFEAWLGARQGQTPTAPPPADEVITGAFTALDFLTQAPRRQEAIAARFGADVAAALAADRRRLIREVFGTLPYYTRPLAERAVNPYRLYWDYLGGGRVFLLPLILARFGLRLAARGWTAFRQMLRELLHPHLRPPPLAEHQFAGYEVALRKINRMRKPLFLAAARLRARVDVEYLGLPLPGSDDVSPFETTLGHDLERIGASLHEREPLERLEARQRRILQGLRACLMRLGWQDEGLGTVLARVRPDLAARPREALRALTMAVVTDHHELTSWIEVRPRLQAGVREAVNRRGRLPEQGPLRHGLTLLAGSVHGLWRWLWPPARREYRAFRDWWRRQGQTLVPPSARTPRAEAWVRRWWRADQDGLRGWVARSLAAD
ncbi:MAG: hypothetical protein R3202_14575, partial [Candidatus Competibacterales bacterium]|nr:hypothetical protein [Candidatus Competibacterales bacterium]